MSGRRLFVLEGERRASRLIRNKRPLQPDLIEALTTLSNCASFDVFLDVGANYGEFANALRRSIRRHILIEPHPVLASLLKVNFSKSMFEVIEAAVSDRSGTAMLHSRDGYLGASSLNSGYLRTLDPSDWDFSSDVAGIDVPALTLDELTSSIPPNSRLLLKIDVEGHEYEVLAGATRLLRQNAEWVIVIEFNPAALEAIDSELAARLWNDLPSRSGVIVQRGSPAPKNLRGWMQTILPLAPPVTNCDVIMMSRGFVESLAERLGENREAEAVVK